MPLACKQRLHRSVTGPSRNANIENRSYDDGLDFQKHLLTVVFAYLSSAVLIRGTSRRQQAKPTPACRRICPSWAPAWTSSSRSCGQRAARPMSSWLREVESCPSSTASRRRASWIKQKILISHHSVLRWVCTLSTLLLSRSGWYIAEQDNQTFLLFHRRSGTLTCHQHHWTDTTRSHCRQFHSRSLRRSPAADHPNSICPLHSRSQPVSTLA